MDSSGVHDPLWATSGIHFKFSAFLMDTVTMCYYKEKKDQTELGWAWHKIVLMFENTSVYKGHLVPAQHQPQLYQGTKLKDLCSEFSTLHLDDLRMYKMDKV